MDGVAIATRSVRFRPTDVVGSQALIEALQNAGEELKDFEFWSSRRWVGDRQYFRLGLGDIRRDIHGEPVDPNVDIVVLPNDGKGSEWFATDDRIESVVVRSRISPDTLSRPLRDITNQEDFLRLSVSIIAARIETLVKEIVERS